MTAKPPPPPPSRPPPPPPRPAAPTTPPPPAGPKKNAAEVLYPVAEVAALWRCSVDHVYDLIARGELRTVPLGIGRAKTRVPASALEEFVAARSAKPKRRRAA